jgi:hypothetical protein
MGEQRTFGTSKENHNREEFSHEYEAQFISFSEAFFAVILAAIKMTRKGSEKIKESEFNQLR